MCQRVEGYEPDEPEVTPEMMEAGAYALASYASVEALSASLSLRDLAAEVFSAMAAAASQAKAQ